MVFSGVIGVHGVVVALVKTSADFVFPPISLNGAAAGQHFLRVAIELAQLMGAFAEQGTYLFGAVAGKEDGHRDHDLKN